MRTTITIDDGLLSALKRRSAETGSTVSRQIEDAVRVALSRRLEASAAGKFELITFGRGGRFSAQDIDKTSALVEAEDLERFAPGRRRLHEL
ncbi:MAG: CopG family transcriptional regulator [bacterium]|nr:CopG family transcriptional regulator [bacterium]